MKKFVLNHAPYWLQDAAISVFNSRQYARRHGGQYGYWRSYYAQWGRASAEDLQAEQSRRLGEFLQHARTKSPWYRERGRDDLSSFQLLEKKHVLEHLDEIATVSESEGVPCYTGGTTGASMRVLFTHEDTQERHACLDDFRSNYGYTLGKRVAWFSGKEIVQTKDLARGRVFRDDRTNKIRFFSTFHINRRNFDAYWAALERFKPSHFVGFPSSLCDICAIALEKGIKPSWQPVAFFPTAETVLPEHRALVGAVFGCSVRDQYASSEGAPFMFECDSGRLHMQILSGVFEVLDEDGAPAQEGELVVTSFSTRGTPLIRYRIGDRVTLPEADESCDCGSALPFVTRIEGRNTDFIMSPENGRVNLGNISNCTKGVAGIVRFQVVQREPEAVEVLVEPGPGFSREEEERFIRALGLRFGDAMKVELRRVEEIPKEKSGKFRIVRNLLPA